MNKLVWTNKWLSTILLKHLVTILLLIIIIIWLFDKDLYWSIMFIKVKVYNSAFKKKLTSLMNVNMLTSIDFKLCIWKNYSFFIVLASISNYYFKQYFWHFIPWS